MLRKISYIRQNFNIGAGRNIAYLEGSVENQVYSEIAASGETLREGMSANPTGIFKFGEAGGFSRGFDSELKLLEDFALKYKDNTSIKAKLTLVSERPVCESCNGVISQFREAFPNVELNVVSGVTK